MLCSLLLPLALSACAEKHPVVQLEDDGYTLSGTYDGGTVGTKVVDGVLFVRTAGGGACEATLEEAQADDAVVLCGRGTWPHGESPPFVAVVPDGVTLGQVEVSRGKATVAVLDIKDGWFGRIAFTRDPSTSYYGNVTWGAA